LVIYYKIIQLLILKYLIIKIKGKAMNDKDPLEPIKKNEEDQGAPGKGLPEEATENHGNEMPLGSEQYGKGRSLNIHFSNMTPMALKEILIKLAADWQRTETQVEQLGQEIKLWEKRKDVLKSGTESEPDTALAEVLGKINDLQQKLKALLAHQALLEKEIGEIQNSDLFKNMRTSFNEYSLNEENVSQKRSMVKNNLETMLGKGMAEILSEEKLEKENREQQVDDDLKRLKEQMKKPD
jgi:type I site-specific restriction-modification system R (restriction) subunit